MFPCARVGPCGSEDKGDISLWLGGKGFYIQTASMTHISCLPEHSLFRSHTRRTLLQPPTVEANLTTMTSVMLKTLQIIATEGFSCAHMPHQTDLYLVVWLCSDLPLLRKQNLVYSAHVKNLHLPIKSRTNIQTNEKHPPLLFSCYGWKIYIYITIIE